MFQPDKDGVYARLEASPARRAMALAVLACLGFLLIYLGFVSLGGIFGRSLLVVLGIGVLLLCDKMRRRTKVGLILTQFGIEDDTGALLVPFDSILSVERGAFAAKPSSGFTIITNQKMPNGWAPGMWWRLGKRFGVGGVSSAGAAKFMAEQVSLRLKS